MANYKESIIEGTSWVRCSNVNISNPIAGTMVPSRVLGQMQELVPLLPTVIFQEEKVIQLGTEKIFSSSGSCSKQFDVVNGVIPLKNPTTGELLGTSVTHTELYIILYSLYLQTALERDTA